MLWCLVEANHEEIIALFTVVLAVVTGTLWRSTERLVRGADDNAARQMRAYVTVVIGGAIFQESGKDLRFEAKPSMVNTGQTPAYRVNHRVRAAILPIPIPADFRFPLPEAEGSSEAVIGSQHDRVLSAVVDGFVLDSQVEWVKSGAEVALCVWGIIDYQDIFGDSHFTKFCQILTWLNDGKVMGHYNPTHSESN